MFFISFRYFVKNLLFSSGLQANYAAKDFFQKDSPHGLVKRIMYKKYLQAFIPITQQAKTRYGEQMFSTVIVDGFAGAGRYGKEWPAEIERYGSPLIALMVSLNYFYRKQHGKDKIWGEKAERDTDTETADLVANMTISDADVLTKLHLYFIEKDPEIFSCLRENIAEVLEDFFPNPDTSYIEELYGIQEGKSYNSYRFRLIHPHYPIVCTLVNAEFAEITPPDIMYHQSAKCLVFLDPFGFSQTPMSHVEKYDGPGKSLLINFMSSYVNRFLEVVNEETIKDLYGMEYLSQQMRDQYLLPEPLSAYVKYLLREYQGEGKPLNNIQSCAANYEECLRRVFKTQYSLTFEMRGRNNCIIYHLIFITDHKKSLEMMKESMNRCSQFENGFSMSEYVFYRNGCELNLAHTQDVNRVADAIYDKFKGSEVKISQVKDYVLLDTPYVFRKKQLAAMEKAEPPRITDVFDSRGNPPSRKRTYPDHTDWTIRFL